MAENEEKHKDEVHMPWKANTLKAIKQYLHFINPLVRTKLSPLEINVLGDILYLDNLYKDVPREIRNTVIFSTETRKKIVKHLETSKEALNNVISSLYKKKYISKDGKLLVKVPINKNNEIKVVLTISLQDDPKDNFMMDPVSNETI